MSKDLYEILCVASDATVLEIKKRYKELLKKFHPDKLYLASEEEKKEAQLKFEEIRNAYTTLSDEKLRASYDKDIKKRGNPKNDSKEERITKNKIDDLFGNYFNFDSNKNSDINDSKLDKNINNLFNSYFKVNKGK